MAQNASLKKAQATTPEQDKSAAAPKGIDQKVELDLDDAPFLEDEEEPEPEKVSEKAPEAPPPQPAPVDQSKPSLLARLLPHKKKLAIAGAVAVVLIGTVVAVNIFLSVPPPPVEPPMPASVEKTKTPPSPPPPTVLLMEWEPFWVEMKDTEGAIHFLRYKMAVPTENPILFAEMQSKLLLLRDAIYYYLRNQSAISLADKEKVELFKSELLTVLNEHLASGKVAEVLIQDYIIQ